MFGGGLCVVHMYIAKYGRTRVVVEHDRTKTEISVLTKGLGWVCAFRFCSCGRAFPSWVSRERANRSPNTRRPSWVYLGLYGYVQAHRQREFMEKKQNELVAKLSDAKLAAVKQQASAIFCATTPEPPKLLKNQERQATTRILQLVQALNAATKTCVYLSPARRLLGECCTLGLAVFWRHLI